MADTMNISVTAHLAETRKALMASGGDAGQSPPDLTVDDNECTTLSADAPRFKGVYRTVRPRTIDEVRRWIGVAPGATDGKGRTPCCDDDKGLGSKMVAADDLRHEEVAVRRGALGLAKAAAREYVMGNAAAVSHWKGVLDRYVELEGPLIKIVLLNDIIVGNGATLTVAANTHALYANRIILQGTGRIKCSGPLTVNCVSFAGKQMKVISSGAVLAAESVLRHL